jgi:HEAT repeat protein
VGQGLEDDDPVVRGLAAIALSQLPALPDDVADLLGKHLKDPDENVRMVVNNALAAYGSAAKRLLPQLIAAAQVPGEHRHVLRSIAVALGSIGPDARSALPVLRELESMPLVRWQAQWAIRKIQGP